MFSIIDASNILEVTQAVLSATLIYRANKYIKKTTKSLSDPMIDISLRRTLVHRTIPTILILSASIVLLLNTVGDLVSISEVTYFEITYHTIIIIYLYSTLLYLHHFNDEYDLLEMANS